LAKFCSLDSNEFSYPNPSLIILQTGTAPATNVDKEFNALCLDCEVAKVEEVNHCHNCHYHISGRSDYLLCYGLDNT
jgi:hypothetical protein